MKNIHPIFKKVFESSGFLIEKKIYLLNNERTYWITFKYEKIEELQEEFKKRNIKISKRSIIGNNVRIKNNVAIGDNAFIADDVIIDNNVIIKNNKVLLTNFFKNI